MSGELDTSGWTWFGLDTLFSVEAGHYYYPSEYSEGDTPYCSASAENNGIGKMIDLLPDFDGNQLIIGKIGCPTFYQDAPFCATSDVNVLTPKFNLTPYVALFIATIINKCEGYKWNYGRQCRVNDTKQIQIKLPATPEGSPDWLFMQRFIKETIIPKLSPMSKAIWEGQDCKARVLNAKISLNERPWQWFSLVPDIFDTICKGTAYNAQDLTFCPSDSPTALPYITRTDANNGVRGYVEYEPSFDVESGNAITIGDTTSTIYYQEDDFICGDHIVVLRSPRLNRLRAMFIVSILGMERFRYSYGRGFIIKSISETKIKLPATPEGSPDWQFMEDYMKSLPYSGSLALS